MRANIVSSMAMGVALCGYICGTAVFVPLVSIVWVAEPFRDIGDFIVSPFKVGVGVGLVVALIMYTFMLLRVATAPHRYRRSVELAAELSAILHILLATSALLTYLGLAAIVLAIRHDSIEWIETRPKIVDLDTRYMAASIVPAGFIVFCAWLLGQRLTARAKDRYDAVLARRCQECDYTLLPDQHRCPECGRPRDLRRRGRIAS